MFLHVRFTLAPSERCCGDIGFVAVHPNGQTVGKDDLRKQAILQCLHRRHKTFDRLGSDTLLLAPLFAAFFIYFPTTFPPRNLHPPLPPFSPLPCSLHTPSINNPWPSQSPFLIHSWSMLLLDPLWLICTTKAPTAHWRGQEDRCGMTGFGLVGGRGDWCDLSTVLVLHVLRLINTGGPQHCRPGTPVCMWVMMCVWLHR